MKIQHVYFNVLNLAKHTVFVVTAEMKVFTILSKYLHIRSGDDNTILN